MTAELVTVTVDGQVVVGLRGEFDVEDAQRLRTAPTKAIKSADTGVTVNMSKVAFIDPAVLGVLVGALDRASHLRGSAVPVTAGRPEIPPRQAA